MSDLDDRKAKVLARLEARKPTAKTEAGDGEIGLFEEQWNEKVAEIQNFLANASHADLPHVSEKLSKLQRFVSEASAFLPAYEARRSQEKLRVLELDVKEQINRLQPKKKFAFRSLRKETKAEGEEAVGSRSLAANPAESGGIVDRDGEEIVVTASEADGKDLLLSDLSNCRIRILGSPNTLHATNLVDCTLLSLPVSTSVFCSGACSSVVVVACQQLRIHSTVDTSFYIHVTSGAIIEDSQRLLLAPYTLTADGMEVQFQKAGISALDNKWDQVKDFNWLSSIQPSPNWTSIPSDQRTCFALN